MDPQLAQIYGTNQESAPEDDLEKMAAAELLVKLAEEEGLDLNQLSEDEISELVNDLYSGDEGGEVKIAAADDGIVYYVDGEGNVLGPVEQEKQAEARAILEQEALEGQAGEEIEAQEKIAEADTLGRVMAHAMVQELNEIEKDAAGKVEAVKKGLQAAGKAVGGHLERVGKRATEVVTGAGKGAATRMKPRTAKAIGAGLYGAGAAGVGGGAYALGKKKESSALEKLAEQRAWEMAKEAGYVDEEGNLLVPGQEKTAEEGSALGQTVDTMALQMLEAAGIPVEWNE